MDEFEIPYYDEVTSFTKEQYEYIIKRANKVDKSLVHEAFQYHAPTQPQIESMQRIRSAAKELAFILLDECPTSADRSDALRKLREVVMTANASIVLGGMI